MSRTVTLQRDFITASFSLRSVYLFLSAKLSFPLRSFGRVINLTRTPTLARNNEHDEDIFRNCSSLDTDVKLFCVPTSTYVAESLIKH